MADLDKVIKGLECCTHDIPLSNNVHKKDFCKECPYYIPEYSYCFSQETLMRDALALLKEQPEIVRCKDCKHRLECDYWIENGDDWFCADGERKQLKVFKEGQC